MNLHFEKIYSNIRMASILLMQPLPKHDCKNERCTSLYVSIIY